MRRRARVFRADHVRLASPAPRPARRRAGGPRDRLRARAGTAAATACGCARGPGLARARRELVEGLARVLRRRRRRRARPRRADADRRLRDAAGARPPDCATARFEFRPQRLANGAYVLSVVAVVLMLGVLLALGGNGVRPPETVPKLRPLPGSDPTSRPPHPPPLALGARRRPRGRPRRRLRVRPARRGRARAAHGARPARRSQRAAPAARGRARCIARAAARSTSCSRPATGVATSSAIRTTCVGAHWVAVLAVLCLLGAGLLLAVRLRRASASGSRSST